MLSRAIQSSGEWGLDNVANVDWLNGQPELHVAMSEVADMMSMYVVWTQRVATKYSVVVEG